MEPKTDREILLLVSQKVDTMEDKFAAGIDRVSDAVEKLATSLDKMETTKIEGMEKRLRAMEIWRLEIKAGYKTLVAIGCALGAVIGYFLDYLIKHFQV